MSFSAQQLHALHALDWLLDGSPHERGTGRTYVIAVALIRQAVRHPGQWVHYFDHAEVTMSPARHRNVVDHLRGAVEYLVQQDTRLMTSGGFFRIDRFQLYPSIPIPNWMPPDDGGGPPLPRRFLMFDPQTPQVPTKTLLQQLMED